MIPQEKQKVCEEETYDENEADKSMYVSENIYASKTIKVGTEKKFITCFYAYFKNLI